MRGGDGNEKGSIDPCNLDCHSNMVNHSSLPCMPMKTLFVKPLLASAMLMVASVMAAPVAAQDMGACLSSLRSSALKQGISASVFDSTLAGVTRDDKVLELKDSQPEFKTPVWDYIGFLADERKVEQGQALLAKYRSVLDGIERRYGVDRHAIVAVWGVESDYGQLKAKFALPRSLATLSCYGRRQKYFRGELISTLKIIQRGDLRVEQLNGSWAGAFGHTQFMPSTYLRLAVDADGDGRRDLVDSIPDALASTANFLKRAGWATGAPWGYEVRLPKGYAGPSGRRNKQPVGSWAGRGLTRIDGRALSGGGNAGLFLPAGRNGPAFLVFRNFDAAYSYNAAESYALAISHLSDRLKGGGPIKTRWPTDDPALSRAERKELQELLTSHGYDVGVPDGAVGQKTRAAIKDVERQIGLRETGRPGGKVLEALRASSRTGTNN
jgi:lytic murein transglycosylase